MFECRWKMICWESAVKDLARNTVHHVATTSTSEYSVLSYYCDSSIESQNRSSDFLIFHEDHFQEWFRTNKTCESECQWFDEW